MQIRLGHVIISVMIVSIITVVGYVVYFMITPHFVTTDSIVHWTLKFSPDSKMVAYARCVETVQLKMGGNRNLDQFTTVYWCAADNPADLKELIVDSVGPDNATMRNNVGVSFSPDSRLLAVVSLNRITIIEPATGNTTKFELSGERVTSFSWRSNEEFVYSGYVGNSENTFWRQKIGQAHGERKAIYVGGSIGIFWSDRVWSPTGRYTVFWEKGMYLLDCDTGKVQLIEADEIGEPSWRRDETMLVLVSDGRFNEYLYDIKTGTTTDVTAKLKKNVSPSSDSSPQSAYRGVSWLWTADDVYFFVNHPIAGRGKKPFLVNPKLWEVKQVPGVDVIVSLPIPGWVKGWKRNGSELSDECFAVSYDGSKMVSLSGGLQGTFNPSRGDDPDPRCSPDMKHAAVIRDKKVIVYDLPPLPPTPHDRD